MRFFRTALNGLVPCLVLAAALRTDSACGQDRVPELLKYMPADVNTISIIRVSEILQSPRAVQENWKEKHESEFLAGSARIPPWVEVLVRSTLVRSGNLGTVMSVSVAPEPENVSLEKLFPKDKVQTDTVSGTRALRSPRGYLAEVAPGILGFMAPPDRQAFSFWLKDRRKDPEIQLPKYLSEVSQAYKPHILFAVNLQELLDPVAMSHRVASSKVLEGKTAEQKAVTHLLARLKGMRLAMQIDKEIHAALAFDFDGATVPEASYLKPLLAELLDDAGAHIDEVETADVKIEPTSVVLSSQLADGSFRRLMTLILTPVSVQQKDYTPPQAKAPPSEAEATQKYFTLVNNTIRDLQVLNHSAKEYNKTATWHDNYARKIGEFPTDNVDPEVVQYGHDMASALRALAASLRGVPTEVNHLENHINYQINVGAYGPAGTWTAWGYNPAPWEVSSNLQETRAAQDDAVEKGSSQRDQIWKSMVSERESTQGRMSQKYNVKFTP